MEPAPNRHFARGSLIQAVAAIPLAIWGGWALSAQHLVTDGVILFTASAILFLRGVLPGNPLVNPAWTRLPIWEGGSASGNCRPYTAIGLAVCLILTWVFSSGNRLRLETLLAWGMACILYAGLFWDYASSWGTELRAKAQRLIGRNLTIPWSVVGLGVVVAIAAFFRYYQLGAVPAEPTSDHAEKLLDVRDVLSGKYSIFFPRNTGREPLQFYMAVPFVGLFGLTPMALKVEQATVSLLTVPVVFLIGRELSGSRFGLVAALLLAISNWDFTIGRMGLRYPLTPLFTSLTLFFLLRGLRRNSRNDFLLCGLVAGLGLYGYTSSRAAVLLIFVLTLIALALEARRGSKRVAGLARNLACCFGAVVVVFLPLAHYMVEHPDDFWYRVLTRVSNLETPVAQSPVQLLLTNIWNALVAFHWRGDVVWVTNVPYQPVLDYVTGALLILGLIWCGYELVVKHQPSAAYLVLAALVMMLPSVMSLSFPAENPSRVRMGGADPVIAVLSAVPLYLVGNRLASLWPRGAWLAIAGLAIVPIAAAKIGFDSYFVDYALQYRQSSINSSEIAASIRDFSSTIGNRENAYLKGWPHWVDARNVAFQVGDPDWNRVLLTTDDVMRHQPLGGNKLYVLNSADAEGVRALQQRFPLGQLRLQASATPGKQFQIFFVPGEVPGR